MIELTVEEVARATGGRLPDGRAGVRVTAVSTDSRDVEPGALFVALRGEHHDGHDHVGDALAAGAVAYLAEHQVVDDAAAVIVDDTWQGVADLARHVRDTVDPVVVAITGSVGKTTTKDLTAAAAAAGRRTVAARGSFNNELGVPLTCLACEGDTEVLVVEVGARGIGHIADLMPLVRPDVAIVTAVSGAHLEMFGDLDTVARAKGELVEALPGDGTAVLNADDERVAAMSDRTAARVLTYAVDVAADLTAEDVELDRLARPSFRARTPWGDADVRLGLAGVHHVGNALAALAAAGVVGAPIEASAAALSHAAVSSWRSEVTDAGGVIVLNDAYNANAASVRAALDALVSVQRSGRGRTWAVLGVMAELGEHAHRDHADVGRHAAALGVDRLVVVGAEAAAIADGARAAGLDPASISRVVDADGALELLAGEVGRGDVVLVKASRVGGLETVAAGLEKRFGEGAE